MPTATSNPSMASRCWASLRRLFRKHRSAIGWAVIISAVLAALVLGTIGFEKNLAVTEPGREYSLLTRVYMVLQMFVLDSGALPEPIGWELEAARLLALLAAAITLVKAGVALFHKQYESLYLRYVSDHVIVAGLGKRGQRLVEDLIKDHERVVAIELEPESHDAEICRELGALVLAGDATNPHVLEKAGVSRAKCLIIVCGNDATSIGIAAAAGELCLRHRKAPRPPLHCLVHVVDHRLFLLLEQSAEGSGIRDKIAYRRWDTIFSGIRRIVEKHPLDRVPITARSPLFVRTVLLGYSREAECLLLQTALMGHGANLRKPQVMLVDPAAGQHEERLRFRFPEIDKACELTVVTRNLEHQQTMTDVETWANEPEAVTTIAISCPDDDSALSLTMGLPPIVHQREVPVLVRLPQRKDLAGLLAHGRHRLRVHVLGDIQPDVRALDASIDRLALAIHEDYTRRRQAAGCSPAQFPAMRPWDELAEHYREANRQQADHVPVKLRAVGCDAVSPADINGQPIADFTSEEIELLARMEHQRWCVDRWLNGWQLGPRDDGLKRHPDLVPWTDLDEATRAYDRDAVRLIPHLLSLVDKVIVRR